VLISSFDSPSLMAWNCCARLVGHANQLQAQLDRGGLLLWVRRSAPEDEWRAVDILRAYGADDAHVHDLPAQHYEDTGGVSYDMSFMERLGL
jgi:hypothetical protein